MTHAIALLTIQVLLSCFFAILFLQSGLDKIINLRNNYTYIHNYLIKTFLSKFSYVLFVVITILELLAGLFSLVGCFYIILYKNSTPSFIGSVLAGVSLLSLFLGQRLAKDYAAAANMVPYIIFSVIGVFFHGFYLNF